MNALSINILHITFFIIILCMLYIYAISLLFKNKSGILPYVALIIFPIIGPVGIILGNKLKKST
jgi:hypothetical protein